jgi:hypothetical protein
MHGQSPCVPCKGRVLDGVMRLWRPRDEEAALARGVAAKMGL